MLSARAIKEDPTLLRQSISSSRLESVYGHKPSEVKSRRSIQVNKYYLVDPMYRPPQEKSKSQRQQK